MKKMLVAAGLFAFTTLFITAAGAQSITGTYAIKNVQTGKLLRPKDANGKTGTPIVLYDPVNWKCMTWDFKSTGANTYQLQNLFTHKTLQPLAKAVGGKTFLDQQPIADGKSEQQWEFVPVDKNTYLIKLKGTDLYLTPAAENDTQYGVELAAKQTGTAQQWTIYEQHPTM